MNDQKKAAHDDCSIESGAGNQISDQTIGHPNYNSITSGQRLQAIADFLPCGAENAVSTQVLVQLSGCKSARQLQTRISEERARGAVILSSPTGGYFLPDTGVKGMREIRDYIATLQARSQNTLRAAESAKTALKKLEEMEGQRRPECGQT